MNTAAWPSPVMVVVRSVPHIVSTVSGIMVPSHAARRATRFEALEPPRQGVREHFGGFAKDRARSLSVRHDHGSQYMSDVFQKELDFLGIEITIAKLPLAKDV